MRVTRGSCGITTVKTHGGYFPSPIPGFPGDFNLVDTVSVSANQNVPLFFHTLRLYLGLVRASPRERVCVSPLRVSPMGQLVIISRLAVRAFSAIRGLLLWSFSEDTNGDKRKVTPNSELAESCSSSQAIAARELEARSMWGVRGRWVHQTAVVGDSQKLVTGYFRESCETAAKMSRNIGDAVHSPPRSLQSHHMRRLRTNSFHQTTPWAPGRSFDFVLL